LTCELFRSLSRLPFPILNSVVLVRHFSTCPIRTRVTRWRSWLSHWFPMVSLEFFVGIIFPAAL